jgi:hypothetical protein
MRLHFDEPERLRHGECLSTDANRVLVALGKCAVARDLAEDVRFAG